MISRVLVRNRTELKEFHEWLIVRANEEELKGKKNNAHVYRELADIVKINGTRISNINC